MFPERPTGKSIATVYRLGKSPQLHKSDTFYYLRRRLYMKKIFQHAKQQYYYTLRVLGMEAKVTVPASVQSGLRHYAVVNAHRRFMQSNITEPFVAFFSVIMLGGVIANGIFLANDENVPQPFLVAAAGIVIISSFIWMSAFFSTRLVQMPAIFIYPIALCAGALFLRHSSLKDPWYVIVHASRESTQIRSVAYAMLLAASAVIAVIFVAAATTVVDAVTIRRFDKNYPNVELLTLLVRAKRFLSQHYTNMSDPNFKYYISLILERAARRIENDLPKSIYRANAEAQSVIQESCDQSAAALRALQLQLALSDEKTLNEARDVITKFIYVVAAGEYGLMPTASPLPRLSYRRRFLLIGRNTVVAAIPLGVVACAKYLGVKFSTGFDNWAIAISLIWAAVTLISLLDPLYKSRIADVREVVSIIRGKD